MTPPGETDAAPAPALRPARERPMRPRLLAAGPDRVEMRPAGALPPIAWEADRPLDAPETPAAVNAFLALAAFPFALRRGRDLRLAGPVDRTLAIGLEQLALALHQHKPRRLPRPIRLLADAYVDAPPPAAAAEPALVAAFSGGVDSSFAAARHAAPVGPTPPIRRLVIVDGFGFPPDRPAAFAMTAEAAARFGEAVGIETMRVHTVWSKAAGLHPTFHPVGLVATLRLCRGDATAAALALDYTYAQEFRRGAHGNLALHGRLLSGADLPVLPLGAEATRAAKLAHLAETGLDRFLTVCTDGDRRRRNCGRCAKCLRTHLAYRALGLAPPEGLFDGAPAPEAVAALETAEPRHRIPLEELVALWRDPADPLLAALRAALAAGAARPGA